jgi:hypothetical protein
MMLSLASQVVNGTNSPDMVNARDGIALLKAVLEFHMDPELTARDVDKDYYTLVEDSSLC